MKLTDFALIFVVVLLPVVIIVYVNTAFVVKAEKQEMYYKNIMNSATTDAVTAMKQVESTDDIDYGYSGIVDKKVSINVDVAISTFYNSLFNNFGIAGNKNSMYNMKMYIPAIAVLDYDGIYIHSAEKKDNEMVFTTKPKVYYTYKYVIQRDKNGEYKLVPLEEISDLNSSDILEDQIYEVTFTMDDYIYINIIDASYTDSEQDEKEFIKLSKNFYLHDGNNNEYLINSMGIISSEKNRLIKEIVEYLELMRKEVIAKTSMREISYAINRHNYYAERAGIKYNFFFTVESDASWYETIDGIGMIAFIQGISLGNRYLNYKAYSAADLILSKKYWVSHGIEPSDETKDYSYYEKELHHISNKCPVYRLQIDYSTTKQIPEYYKSKGEAATNGFHPCPICKP